MTALQQVEGGASALVRGLEAWRLSARPVRWAIFAGFAATLMVIGLVVVAHLVKDLPFRALMQDPTAYLGAQAYIGAVSTLGGVLWAIAGTAACLAALAVHRAGGPRGERAFFLAFGLLSFALSADDLLQLHEDLLPLAGVPQTAILLLYGGLGVAHLVVFRAAILARPWPLLAIAVAFLGLSVGQDLVFPHGDLQTFFEDSAKLGGIVFWALFFGIASADTIAPPR
ncbi:MAG: hypothetical protein ACFE0R_07150 [Salinarimonas sp.]